MPADEGESYPYEISDFEYRRTFGLTQEELLQEPAEVYLINSFILAVTARIQAEQAEKARLKTKG